MTENWPLGSQMCSSVEFSRTKGMEMWLGRKTWLKNHVYSTLVSLAPLYALARETPQDHENRGISLQRERWKLTDRPAMCWEATQRQSKRQEANHSTRLCVHTQSTELSAVHHLSPRKSLQLELFSDIRGFPNIKRISSAYKLWEVQVSADWLKGQLASFPEPSILFFLWLLEHLLAYGWT